ncbi:MAG: hypothetical protein IK152_02390 [Lachnospiraceae bacterium]|nr:hypothetical protein [Lachnospiraceae bacterium]
MKEYRFWGWQNADIAPINRIYKGIGNPRDLYDALTKAWCPETCAPRMRSRWTKDNMTLGQCAVTAFLAQDIFGGKVYGILCPGGFYHCYNVVGDCKFDLTCEQFEGKPLDYANSVEQFRSVHLLMAEKYERYRTLKTRLREVTG